MRVSDINYDVGDNLFIYALIISSKKSFIFQSHSRGYDKQNQSKIEKQKTAKNKFGSFRVRNPINSNSFS